jgi:hypothetical protein
MTSSDLSKFSNWQEWNPEAVRKAPNLPGVYAFRLAGKSFGRFNGSSDLVYIGCTESVDGTIQRRLSDHLPSRANVQSVARRLLNAQKVGKIEVCWKALKTAEEASKNEAKLLRAYVRDHIELPPINRNEPDADTRLKIEAVAEYIQSQDIFKCQSLEDARELAEKLVEYVEANWAQWQTERE